jgi:hypothetical protein
VQTNARIAKAQADLRTLADAIALFSAVCGDVFQTPRTWTGPVTPSTGTTTCARAMRRSGRHDWRGSPCRDQERKWMAHPHGQRRDQLVRSDAEDFLDGRHAFKDLK